MNCTYIIYGFHIILRTNSNYFPENINILVFVMEIHHITSEEGTEFFNITLMNFMLTAIYLPILSLSCGRNKFLALSKTTVSLSADGR